MSDQLKIVRDNTGMSKDLVLDDVPAPVIEQQAAPEPEVPQELQALAAEPEEQEAPVVEEKPKETRSAQNFKALKTEAARLAKERDEAKALLAQYEAEKKARQVPVAPSYDADEDINLDEDAYAEGKHVKALAKQLRNMKAEIEATKRQAHSVSVRAALVAEHPDYERVMTAENLQTLELTYPHIARSINMNDPYNAGKACYDLIKQFGIDADEVSKTEVTKQMIKQNLAKPKPGVASMGTKNTNESPMGRASEFYDGPLTDEMKKIFYKEMQDAMNKMR
jgi:hypothetical protein